MFELGLGVTGIGGLLGVLAFFSWLAVRRHAVNARSLGDLPFTPVSELPSNGRQRVVIGGRVAAGHRYTEPLEGRQVAFHALRILLYLRSSGSSSGSKYKKLLHRSWGDDLVVEDGTGSIALHLDEAKYAFYWDWKDSHLLTTHFEMVERPIHEHSDLIRRVCDREGLRTRSLLGRPERLRVQQFSLAPGDEVTVSGFPSAVRDEKGRQILESGGKKSPLYLTDLPPKALAQRLQNWGRQRRLSAVVLSIMAPLFIAGGVVLIVLGM